MFCVKLIIARIAEMGSAARKLFLTSGRLLADSVVGNASGVQLVRIIRRLAMVYPIENKMVVDAAWDEDDLGCDNIPQCECCEEKIKQFRALHILFGKKRVWICDRCIEDMKEVTGY